MKKIVLTLFILAIFRLASADDCSKFENLGCQDQAHNNPADWSKRSFQTPLPGSPYYHENYESLGKIMCHVHNVYASDK